MIVKASSPLKFFGYKGVFFSVTKNNSETCLCVDSFVSQLMSRPTSQIMLSKMPLYRRCGAKQQQSRRICLSLPSRTKLNIKMKRGTAIWNKQMKTTWRVDTVNQGWKEDTLNQGLKETTSKLVGRAGMRKGPAPFSQGAGQSCGPPVRATP